MKIGDIVVNPYVSHEGIKNPMYKTIVIQIGEEWTRTLMYNGNVCIFMTK